MFICPKNFLRTIAACLPFLLTGAVAHAQVKPVRGVVVAEKAAQEAAVRAGAKTGIKQAVSGAVGRSLVNAGQTLPALGETAVSAAGKDLAPNLSRAGNVGISQENLLRELEETLSRVEPVRPAWKNFSGDLPAIKPIEKIAPTLSNSGRALREKMLYRRYKGEGLSEIQALRRVSETLGPRPNRPWPQTTQGTLEVASFDGLTLDGYTGDTPTMPIPTNNIYLYRGMGLDADGLRNVLQNGLRVEDVKTGASAIDIQSRLLSVGTMPVSSEMLQPFAEKQTYLAVHAERTVHFAYMHAFEEGKLPVIVVVDKKWRVSDGDHVITQDIPAADLKEVAILVNGPQDTPIWCKVSLAQDGQRFVLAPYTAH